jgi:hypothetical protein
MFAAVLVVLAVVALVRLAVTVRNDRPRTAPRSHSHELDPQTTRLLHVR